jgi:hypothetical protein
MSLSEFVSPNQGPHPKLGYILAAAVLAAVVLVPAGMRMTQRLAPPSVMMPPAPRPIEPMPGQSAPAEASRRPVAPMPAVPRAESPRSDVTSRAEAPASVAAPPADAPATNSPPPTLSAPAEDPPDLAVAPGAALTPNQLAALRKAFLRQQQTAHAAVYALLESMAKRKPAAAKSARRGAKPRSGAALKAKHNAPAPQPVPSPISGPVAPPAVVSATPVALDLDRHGARPIGLGRAAPIGLTGLNGTAFHHRP